MKTSDEKMIDSLSKVLSPLRKVNGEDSYDHSKLMSCPAGKLHTPSNAQMAGYFWVECAQCGRESYAVHTEAEAVSAWSSDVGLKGRSNLIANIKAGVVRSSVPAV